MNERNNANVRTDVDGYLVNANDWNVELALEMAMEAGISQIS
jgi:sulfur relay (sulfurtransferase) DsrC/TusE family protein